MASIAKFSSGCVLLGILLSAPFLYCCRAQEIITQHPMDTTVCEGNTATFTCVIFYPSGTFLVPPGWRRNGAVVNGVNMIRNNLTNSNLPVFVSSTLTINRTTISDDGALYQCGLSAAISNNATLNVVVPPMSAPTITGTTPLSNTSFTVNWTISSTNYDIIVILTNLRTGENTRIAVPDSAENSYTVMTGLNGIDNYNVSLTANSSCGMMMSDPITVYDPPNEPQFTQCISYNNNEPALQVLSYVTVETPRMSMMMLNFTASYRAGNNITQSAMCSSLSDMQFNCTAEFAIDIIPLVDTIESVNVVVEGYYGDASSENRPNLVVAAVSNVTEDVSTTSATLTCTLPCFSPNLSCDLVNITRNDTEANITRNDTEAIRISNDVIMGLVMSYSYPTQQIMISNLINDTMYIYCVAAYDNNNMIVGKEVCDSFTTMRADGNGGGNGGGNGDDDDESSNNIGPIIGGIIGALIVIAAIIIIVIVIYKLSHRDKDSTDSDKQGLKSPTGTGGSHTASIKPAGNVPAPSGEGNVPHQTAASGEEYAVATRGNATKPQQPTEYAMVDKSKKHAAATQGITYADLQDLPASSSKPPTNQGPTSTYAMVA